MDTADPTTSGANQRGWILKALSTGPKTSYELRRMGYDIRTERVTIWDQDGYRHSGVALYSLAGEA